MRPDRLKSSDTLGGLLFVVLGLAFLIGGRQLTMGSASRMGPGWFPIAVSLCLTGIGLVIVLRAVTQDMPDAPAFVWRPLILICLGLAAFILTLKPLGLALAIVLSVVISSYAHPGVRLRRMLPYAVLLGIACCVVFVKWLGLQMPIVGDWLIPVLGRW